MAECNGSPTGNHQAGGDGKCDYCHTPLSDDAKTRAQAKQAAADAKAARIAEAQRQNAEKAAARAERARQGWKTRKGK